MWMREMAARAKKDGEQGVHQVRAAIQVRKLWLEIQHKGSDNAVELIETVLVTLGQQRQLLQAEGLVENLLDVPNLCLAAKAWVQGCVIRRLGSTGAGAAGVLSSPAMQACVYLIRVLAGMPQHIAKVSNAGVFTILIQLINRVECSTAAADQPEQHAQASRCLASISDVLETATSHRSIVSGMITIASMANEGNGDTLALVFTLLSTPRPARQPEPATILWPAAIDLQRIGCRVALSAVAKMDAILEEYLCSQGCVEQVLSAVAGSTSDLRALQSGPQAAERDEAIAKNLMVQMELVQLLAAVRGYHPAASALRCA
jgi:hypothetical protein